MRALAVIALALCPGCYLFHGAEGTPERMPDAGRRIDAGARADAGRDAGRRDAGPSLPPEPDEDLGADSRPSDYPDADEWEDPPAIGEEDPCCVLGEPQRLTSRDEGMSLSHEPPLIEWGEGRWGLLVVRHYLRAAPEAGVEVVLWELAGDGSAFGAPQVLETPDFAPDMGETESLLYAEGRWAVAVSGDAIEGNQRTMFARLFDRDFRPATDWLALSDGYRKSTHVARLTHGGVWLAASSGPDGLVVTPFDELGAMTSRFQPAEGARVAGAVGLRSRMAMVVDRYYEPDSQRELVILGPSPEHTVLGRLTLGTDVARHSAIAALRDSVVVASVGEGRVESEILDPFAISTRSSPRAIGELPLDPDVPLRDVLDVAGSDKYGLAGICWGVPGNREAREDSRIMFAMVDEDGQRYGAPVTVVESPFRGSMVNCSVGSDDYGFLVGWWNGSELWVRRVDVAR